MYEDAHVVAVSKPAGVLTHEPKKRGREDARAEKKARDGTLVEALLARSAPAA